MPTVTLAGMNLASSERAAICDAFDAAGPAHPTLCGDWTTADLLAHLLVRERQPWAAVGVAVPRFASMTEKAMEGWATTPWADRVALLRGGAPWWVPTRIPAVDGLVNGAELFVHHEDIRRAVPGWEPRPSEPARDAELWTVLQRMGRLLYRKSPVGVALRRATGQTLVPRSGEPHVTLVGDVGEFVMHGFGRSEVRIEMIGNPESVSALESASRGV